MPLLPRQIGGDNVNNNSGDTGFWWSSTGLAIRYSVLVFIGVCLLAFFLGGYAHARRREAKGLPPLRYHAWMVRKTGYPRAPTAHYQFSRPQNEQAVHMDRYPQPPPPAYNAADAPPPLYQPPPGATKVQANQSFGGTEREGESSRRQEDTVPRETGTQ